MVKKPARSRWPNWVIQIVLGLSVSGLVIAGVVAVGNVAREALGPQDRYLLPFNEIECPTPKGQQPTDFLGEVQYIGTFPDQINVLDATLAVKLREAFERHPKVERVEKVTISPPKKVRIELVLRGS